jgi:glycosyltransferase involved in cell wall biosynthesis
VNILALNWQDLTNPMSGGAEVHLEELLYRFVKKGHDVTLFCSGYKGCLPEETIEGVRIIRRGNRYNFNLIAPWELRCLVKRGNFDCMLEDINKIPFYTPLYLKIPTVVLIPHLFSTTVFQEVNFLMGLYVYLWERPLTAFYKHKRFNVPSDSTRDDLIGRGIPKDNIWITHCGVDSSSYTYDPNISKYEKPTILYLGRIKKYKSIDHLIIAFNKILKVMPEVRLKIVGAGDYLPKLKFLAATLNITDKIDFPGFVSHEEKVDIMRRSHVAVYPSPKEGWGLTNIEANACGTCAIAANSPGLRDSVSDNKTGFLYEYGNIDQLVEKIMTVLTDSEIRQRFENGGREWAARFSWDDAADQFLVELEKVAERGY